MDQNLLLCSFISKFAYKQVFSYKTRLASNLISELLVRLLARKLANTRTFSLFISVVLFKIHIHVLQYPYTYYIIT